MKCKGFECGRGSASEATEPRELVRERIHRSPDSHLPGDVLKLKKLETTIEIVDQVDFHDDLAAPHSATGNGSSTTELEPTHTHSYFAHSVLNKQSNHHHPPHCARTLA